MADHVFICYANEDERHAKVVCSALEARGIQCWIAPRDVPPGIPYGEAIIDAIAESRVLVLVLSSSSNESNQVPREVERAASRGIPILPFRIEDVAPSKEIELFISGPHWLDACTPPLRQHLEPLGEAVENLLRRDATGAPPPTQPEENAAAGPPPAPPRQPEPIISPRLPSATPAPSPRTRRLLLLGAAIAVVAAVILASYLLRIRASQASTQPRQFSDGEASASTVLQPAARYAPSLALDGDRGTAWCWPPPAEGSSLTISYPSVRLFTRVEVLPGYDKVHPTYGHVFFLNNRVKRVRFEFPTGYTQTASFEDVPRLQRVTIDPPVRGDRVRLVVEAVYPGSRWRDTGISEIRVWGLREDVAAQSD